MQSSSTKEVDGTLNRLAENERHFHTIQAGVRGLASTWILAAFAGIAVLLQQKSDVTWLFPPFALVTVICLMANIGLSTLWVIDQLVYQRLFNTNYLAGLRLEQQFSFIPPVRAIQAFTRGRSSIAFWVQFFYEGPLLAFALIALVAAIIKCSSNTINPTGDPLCIGAMVTALLALAPLVWTVYQARKVPFTRLAKSLPSDFSEILEPENCRTIIVRHVESLKSTNMNIEKT